MSGLDITNWGPAGWKFIHAITFAAPDTLSMEERRHYFDALVGLGRVLPCKKCCCHYRQFIQKHVSGPWSHHFHGRDSVSRLFVEAHNEVNRSTGNPIVHYDQVAQTYKATASSCGGGDTKHKHYQHHNHKQALEHQRARDDYGDGGSSSSGGGSTENSLVFIVVIATFLVFALLAWRQAVVARPK